MLLLARIQKCIRIRFPTNINGKDSFDTIFNTISGIELLFLELIQI